jgi:hypothetical protein
VLTHRDDGKRFVVRADEKLTAFMEVESAIGVSGNCFDFFGTSFCRSRSTRWEMARHGRKGNGTTPNQRKEPPMKAKSSRFDSLVARYYPAVYSFASRLTDDPREAIALTRNAFRSAHKQLCSARDQTAVATTLISAVIQAGLAAA